MCAFTTCPIVLCASECHSAQAMLADSAEKYFGPPSANISSRSRQSLRNIVSGYRLLSEDNFGPPSSQCTLANVGNDCKNKRTARVPFSSFAIYFTPKTPLDTSFDVVLKLYVCRRAVFGMTRQFRGVLMYERMQDMKIGPEKSQGYPIFLNGTTYFLLYNIVTGQDEFNDLLYYNLEVTLQSDVKNKRSLFGIPHLEENLHTSIRALATETGLSESSIHKMLVTYESNPEILQNILWTDHRKCQKLRSQLRGTPVYVLKLLCKRQLTFLKHLRGASPKSGQISIQIFRYTVPPPEIVIGVQESLRLVGISHILKMAVMLKPSAEYNRRAAIIEDLRAGRSATEIIRFFGYPRSTVYDVVAKYTALEQSNEGSSMPARKSHSKERTARIPAVVERAQTLISDDPRQSLRKLASIVGVSEPTMRRIAEEDL
ncbi:hypothetical protein G5I_00435 [Acromyrmex echinatior]|uniref:DUF4817 domain-containing protein n=1 Tax=Acromyrmex echinatior TaxID=103372 RepID=F4W4V7_ACREC|nr:hypothetical protein G5I_00435 [Acromyrmex echinatior]